MDVYDRILGWGVSLSLAEAVKYCPDDPRKCAATLWPDQPFSHSLVKVTEFLVRSNLTPPGHPHRTHCYYAEAETVLCMLKGYFITKKHRIGDDIAEKHKQLEGLPEYVKYLPPQIIMEGYTRGELETA